MKRTVLDLTQNILSAMSSDEVNSIGDTTESLQVAEIIRTTYYNMLGRYDLPEHNQLLQLTASASIDQPVLMYSPDAISKIDWIKYYVDTADNSDTTEFIHDLDLDVSTTSATTSPPPAYKDIIMLPIKDFIDMIDGFNIDEDNVESFNLMINSVATGENNTFIFRYKNDQPPQYCTILQNYYVIFDAYDGSVDDTLQTSKTKCSGWVTPIFRMEDTFIPDLDDQRTSLLLNEAKSLAFLELKNSMHPKAEQEVKRQVSSLQKFKSTSNRPTYFNELPNFGRRRSYGTWTNSI